MNEAREAQASDALRTAAIVVGLSIALLLLWVARNLVLTVFLGVLFALAVSAGADRLQRWKIPRGVAAPLIVRVYPISSSGTTALLARSKRQSCSAALIASRN